LLTLLFAGGACAADDAALETVEACRVRLDPHTDIGIERIQKRCPELLPALTAAPWRGLLPGFMLERREELSAESLRALTELVRAASAVPTAGSRADPRELAPILAELGARGQEGATRWERFKRWLEELRAGQGQQREGLISRWSRELSTSEGVARAITYVGYGMLATLVAFVIWAELRAAGLFSARRRAAARASPEAQWRRRLRLADVNAAPLAERPGMLLRLLGEALTRAHRLPAADGLTAPAIARRAELDAGADRAELAQLAATAERIRYAEHVPAAETLEETVATGKALLAKIARLSVGRR
jgi:hypothetical protein